MLTMPQIIMLNHGAEVNKQRMDNRLEQQRAAGDQPISDRIQDTALGMSKSIKDMTTEEYLLYHRTGL